MKKSTPNHDFINLDSSPEVETVAQSRLSTKTNYSVTALPNSPFTCNSPPSKIPKPTSSTDPCVDNILKPFESTTFPSKASSQRPSPQTTSHRTSIPTCKKENTFSHLGDFDLIVTSVTPKCTAENVISDNKCVSPHTGLKNSPYPGNLCSTSSYPYFYGFPPNPPFPYTPFQPYLASQTQAITHNVYSQFNTNCTPESPYSSRKVYNSDMKTNNLMWNPNQGDGFAKHTSSMATIPPFSTFQHKYKI